MNHKTSFRDWLHLFRLWSLTATITPLLAVFAFNLAAASWSVTPILSYSTGTKIFHLLLTLLSCGSLQICCNLLNTWGDFHSGVDTPERCPTRSELVDGVISPRQAFCAAVTFLAIGIFLGLILLLRCFSWNLLLLAFIGILGSINYSTGIRFKYRGLGVPFVFFLMGALLMLAADLCYGGALYRMLSDGGLSALFAVLFLLPISCLVANILHANDMRDIEDDAEAGIKTLSTALGSCKAFSVYAILHLIPLISTVAFWLLFPKINSASGDGLHVFLLLLPLLTLPLVVKTITDAWRGIPRLPHQKSWFGLIVLTAKIHLLTGVLQATALFFIR